MQVMQPLPHDAANLGCVPLEAFRISVLSSSRRQMLGHKSAHLCGKVRRFDDPSYVCRI